MAFACGIDFGTSNSTLGVMAGNRPTLIALEGGSPTMPSAVFYDFEERQTYFGRAAMAAYVQGTEGRFIRAFKTILGTSLMDEQTQLRGQRSVGFPEIIGTYLAHIKRVAEQQVQSRLTHVVVGTPAHFVDGDPDADERARGQLGEILRSIGFEAVEFQYEPIAAALDYETSAARADGLALIADIGGGTADFSIIRTRAATGTDVDRAGDILATHGVRIGGNELDRLVSLGKVMPLLGYGSRLVGKRVPVPSWIFGDLSIWHCINSLYAHSTVSLVRRVAEEAEQPDLVARLLDVIEHRLGHYLLAQAEAAKIGLTDREKSFTAVALPTDDFGFPLSRAEFARLIGSSLSGLRAAVDFVLTEAKVDRADINDVFLTGGTTLAPAVNALFAMLCPNAAIVPGDRFGSVGLGLALESQRRFGV